MKNNKLVLRALDQSAALAPVTGAAGTVYGIYSAFSSLRTSHLTWWIVAGGIAHALAATAVLLVGVPLLAMLYGLGTGRGDGNDAA